jgi:hypothetical protein
MNTESNLEHGGGEAHEEWPAEQHDEWKMLCALGTTKSLTDEERARLQEHLATCAECREVSRQYQVLAHETLPPMAADYIPAETGLAGPGEIEPDRNRWETAAVKARLLARADNVLAARTREVARPKSRRWVLTAGAGIAAALVFALGLRGGYRLGRHAAPGQVAAVNGPSLKDTEAEIAALDLKLAEENQRIASLEAASAQRAQEETELKTKLDAAGQEIEQSAQDKAAATRNFAQTLATTQADRDGLQAKLHDAQQNYETIQQELTALKAQRQQDQLHYASLELEVGDLQQRLTDSENRVKDSNQYLAQDRDIRELMGARQLYIADVNDMDATGEPRKPFGRVFYTKGKSLVFYAFDLDQQPGVKEASFQAWAHEGSDRTHPVSLGVFYVDSEANRRWALKTEDPKLLAEINSVFVTVEPKGGSAKPTGRQLLYAYLKTELPNHP